MSNFEKTLKELTEDHLKALVNEIYEYFQMLPNIYDNKVKNRLNNYKGTIFKQYSLDPEKLKDPLYLPEILKLAFYIVNNNRELFSHDWNTHSYYHHDRNDVILNLTEHLEPISERIKLARLEKFEKSIAKLKKETSELVLTEEDKYISISFSEYDLLHYDDYLSLINKSALFNDFYKLIPSQLRCLFENLLYDIFSKSLHNNHKDLYFSKDQRKARNFVKLIDLLDFLKDLEFKEYLREKITKDTIRLLEEIREKGNFTVHDIMDKVTRKYIDDWKEEISLILKPLLVCYKELKGKEIRLEKGREIKLKKKWGMIKDKKYSKELDTKQMEREVPKPKKELENLNIFFKVINHELKFTKGQLISLVKKIGNINFNKYVNLQLRERDSFVKLINESWVIVINGPKIPKPYIFFIIKIKDKIDNHYRDNEVDPGNVQIYNEFVEYLREQLKISKDNKEIHKEELTFEIKERNRIVQRIYNIIKELLERASSNSCYGKEGYACWEIEWNIPSLKYIDDVRQSLKNFKSELKFLFLDKDNPLKIYNGRYIINEKELLIDTAFNGTRTFDKQKIKILNEIRNYVKDNFNIDLIH